MKPKVGGSNPSPGTGAPDRLPPDYGRGRAWVRAEGDAIVICAELPGLAAVFLAVVGLAGATEGYYRYPTLAGDTVVFAAEGGFGGACRRAVAGRPG